ncbi:hypothetical protein ACWV16_24955 [Achromobacter xylosoxidans]
MKEVAEVQGDASANKYIGAGWKILAIATMTTDAREHSGPVIKYSLGWFGNGKPVYPSNF